MHNLPIIVSLYSEKTYIVYLKVEKQSGAMVMQLDWHKVIQIVDQLITSLLITSTRPAHIDVLEKHG